MNLSPFQVTASAFEFAPKFQIDVSRIARFPLVDQLVSATGTWFRELRDEESHHAKELRIQVWRLRTAALYSLVEFDDPALDMLAISERIVASSKIFPGLKPLCDQFEQRARALVNGRYNPKRDRVRTELARHTGKGKKVGLIIALSHNHLPALTSKLIEDYQTLGQGIQFVASRRHLLTSTFDHIFVPFGTRQCALTNEVLCGYRAPSATVIAYHCEAMTHPRRVRLPCAISTPDRTRVVNEKHDPPQNVDDALDKNVFWSAIKQAEDTLTDNSATTDTAYFVQARGFLLANGAHVFLRDDSKAFEISDLVEGRRNFETRLPRTPVKQLQTGDLIVLRVQGSGGYLVEVADNLMRKDGKAGLRGSAMDWKPMLKNVLTEFGSRWFLKQLEKRGFRLANHNYIWKWTTDEVISPQKESYFYEIIAILDDCRQGIGDGDVLRAAQRRWEELKELKRYHQKAGREIRRNLLSRLEKIIDSRPSIGSEYMLQIPGVSAGTLAIVRIAAVDTEVVTIPYHRAGVVLHVGIGDVE